MGWLGWSPEQALDTPMPLVALALRGRTRMMRTQFDALARLLGAAPEPEPEPDDAAVAARVHAAFSKVLAREADGKSL